MLGGGGHLLEVDGHFETDLATATSLLAPSVICHARATEAGEEENAGASSTATEAAHAAERTVAEPRDASTLHPPALSPGSEHMVGGACYLCRACPVPRPWVKARGCLASQIFTCIAPGCASLLRPVDRPASPAVAANAGRSCANPSPTSLRTPTPRLCA